MYYTSRVGQPTCPRLALLACPSRSLPHTPRGHVTSCAHCSLLTTTAIPAHLNLERLFEVITPVFASSSIEMQVLAPFFFVWVLGGVKGSIRTPLEAFRPSGELYVKRPDKLPLLPHRKTSLPPKGGLKILYQTGVSGLRVFLNVLVILFILWATCSRNFETLCCHTS